MKRHIQARRSFALTVAVAMALCLIASVKSMAAEHPQVIRVSRVSDSELATVQGKYFGSNLLVGVRIDLISNWRAPGGAVMQGIGALQMQRDSNGAMQVNIHSEALATGNTDGITPLPNSMRNAQGAEGVSADGLSQVTQLAGNHNAAANLAQIDFTDALGDTAAFNGASYASAAQGGYSTEVRFAGNGISMQLQSPDGTAMQRIGGDSQGVMQSARIAGDNQNTNNTLNLQIQTSAVPEDLQRQWGVQNALTGIRGLPQTN